MNISDAKTIWFRLRLLRAKSQSAPLKTAFSELLFDSEKLLLQPLLPWSLLRPAPSCQALASLLCTTKQKSCAAGRSSRQKKKKHTIILITQLRRVPSARPHIPTPSGGANVSSCTAVGKTILNILNDLLDHKNNKTVSGSRGLG